MCPQLEGIDVKTNETAEDKVKEECCPGAPFIIIAPMHWIAPTEKDTDAAALVSCLSASDGERAGVRGAGHPRPPGDPLSP